MPCRFSGRLGGRMYFLSFFEFHSKAIKIKAVNCNFNRGVGLFENWLAISILKPSIFKGSEIYGA